ncbi:MAG: hypothetical protein IPI81_16890 [Flavobacteriales bacterium]|nr:hypothetical protein [Flavobacteriales bacterium]MCC6937824.1 hypothetical protein [Flavobacteriales bacterium]
MDQRRLVFLLLALPLFFFGCNGCGDAPAGALDYLKESVGKYPKREGVLDSEPLHARLQALLGGQFPLYWKNWDAEAPLEMKDGGLFASGCVSHFCDAHGSALFIDLAHDKLIAILRVDHQATSYAEQGADTNALPPALVAWIGADPVTSGDAQAVVSLPESTGGFAWMPWSDVPADVKAAMKKLKVDRKTTLFAEAMEAVDMECDVQVAQYDLDGDGKPGTLVTYSCSFWCGQVGCPIKAYDGGKMLDLVDEVSMVRPGKGGLITSKDKLLVLK